MTVGKRGLRKRKGINEEMINESDGETVRRLTIRGKTRTKNILQGTMDRAYNLYEKVWEEERAKVKDIILNPTTQFKHSRINNNMSSFKQSLEKNSDRVPNTLISKRGVY